MFTHLDRWKSQFFELAGCSFTRQSPGRSEIIFLPLFYLLFSLSVWLGLVAFICCSRSVQHAALKKTFIIAQAFIVSYLVNVKWPHITIRLLLSTTITDKIISIPFYIIFEKLN